jgi:hypothetical protein
MDDVFIGRKVRGFSTVLMLDGEGFRVSAGWSNSGCDDLRRRVVNGDFFGISFVVTDEEKCEQLVSACQRRDEVAVRRLLASFIPGVLAERPELFTRMLEEQFEAGVREGRRQKAREFRKVLEEN